MSEEDLQAKQVYLRENILEKGYDGESFMIFCKQKCGEIDLENWTLDFLKNIVSSFIKENSSNAEIELSQKQDKQDDWSEFQTSVKQQPEKKQSQIEFSQADWQIFLGGESKKQEKPLTISASKQSQAPKIQTSMSPPSNIKVSTEKQEQKKQKVPEITIKSEELKSEKRKIQQIRTIKMKTLKAKQLAPLPTINDVTILKTEQKTRNFLQGDYTLYHIKFSPCNHIIQRKFNDIRKLRVILLKLYPYIRLPYLEPQGWLVNSSEARDQQTLQKYKYMVVEFLKYITMRNQTLKKSKIVRIFTGMIEGTSTDFKKYENIQRPKKVSELCIPEGQLKFSEYECLPPIDKYMTNTQLLIADIDGCYQKLRKTMETLYYNYEQVSKSVTEVGYIFECLQNLVTKFNFENGESRDLRIYEGLKEMCCKMRETISNQYTIFKTKIQNLFRFEKENMTTFKEVNEIRSKMYAEYIRQGCNSKVTESPKNPAEIQVQSNISIEQVCKNNKNILKIQNMMWSYYTLENVHLYWKELRFKINEQLTLIAYDQLDSENDNLNFWNTVIKKCVI